MPMGHSVKKGTFWFQNWQTLTFHKINFETIKKINAALCKPTFFTKSCIFQPPTILSKEINDTSYQSQADFHWEKTQ